MRLAPVLGLVLLARLAAAQATGTARQAAGARVSGVVRDSIARAPLAGAVVQLVSADSASHEARTTTSDSLGRFAFDSVAVGRYAIGFFHALVDSLGVELPTRDVYVDGRRPVRVDLATPSPARLRAAICRPKLLSDSGAVIVGFVRDARDRSPAANANVTAEWLEITIKHGGIDRRVPHLSATTGERGWFALCDLPSPGTIEIVARRGVDSTDQIELEIPPSGLLHHEFYVGPGRTVAIDSTSTAARRDRTGDGTLSGVVVSAADGQPLAGARIGIAGGAQTRANASGEWVLSEVPRGTRMLEVRALGYYPERRPVDVLDGAAPVRVVLSTMRAVLDTVRVNASRLANRQQSAFDARRRSGNGRYLTADDIERRRPQFTSDLFRSMPGVRFDRTNVGVDQLGAGAIMLRGAVTEWCAPAVYIDGHYMFELSADELDSWVQPSEIVGIEVYSGTTAPAEYQTGLSGCGSIVIWTNVDNAGDKPKMSKGRIITGVAVALFAVFATLLVPPR